MRPLLIACAAVALLLAPPSAHALDPPPVPESAAGAPAGTLLATGDSMMQVIEHAVARELGAHGAGVVLDSRVGSGISKPFLFDWVAYARRQALLLRPRVTVVFLGAGDIYDLRVGGRPVRCCGPRWEAAYSRRVLRMLRSYQRGGDSRVYWLNLPTPRDRRLAAIHRIVDRAVARAVRRAGDGARVIDVVSLFTPGRRFRRAMRWEGRRQVVRMADGVHLSAAGARIAARHIRAVLQRDRLLAGRT
jgi:hypothetical protein